MKHFCLTLLILFSVSAFAQEAPTKTDDSKVSHFQLSSYHLEQLKFFDDQQKDIQTAASVLENSRKLFLNTIVGRVVTDADSIIFKSPNLTILPKKVKPTKSAKQ